MDLSFSLVFILFPDKLNLNLFLLLNAEDFLSNCNFVLPLTIYLRLASVFFKCFLFQLNKDNQQSFLKYFLNLKKLLSQKVNCLFFI